MRGREFDLENFYEMEREFYDALALRCVDLQVRIAFWERSIWKYIKKILGDVTGNTILHLGCGFGYESILLAKEGAVVTGVDISGESIKKAINLSKKEGVDVTFEVANVDTLGFEEEFDIVLFRSSLHHFPSPFESLKRSYHYLKDGGLAIAQEPRLRNPFAMVGRLIQHKRGLATRTEHPFMTGELEEIFKRVFQEVHVKCFMVLSPIYFSLDLVLKEEPRIKKATFSILETIDEKLLLAPFMMKYAWIVICHARKGKN